MKNKSLREQVLDYTNGCIVNGDRVDAIEPLVDWVEIGVFLHFKIKLIGSLTVDNIKAHIYKSQFTDTYYCKIEAHDNLTINFRMI